MFEAAIGWLSLVGLLLVGLIARVLLAILIIAAIVTPIAAVFYAWRGVRALADHLVGLRRVGHLRWRDGCFYTPGHLWLRPAGEQVLRVGIDDLARRVLPDVDAVQLPSEGTTVRAGDPIGRIQCAGGGVTLRAPIGGTIKAVNPQLQRQPELLHADPYRRAWMIELRPENTQYRRFAAGQTARSWLAAEDQRLSSFFERQLGIAAADGGELILPPHKLLTPAQWEAVRAYFLDAA
jgi:glycine cleavage system H lipoate-binding protein